ncbi:glutamate-1-semialdehyde 2,1-aminomutase [Archaeoglobus sulfaticallidus PM70-1]|uniref:Glutamate-1-semialdehyde 2,1-aminomutase n=1 Tax=Archaeoglobus sulfaticallidus PM70-1 TaxID=387631 RepID=N0BEB8_9EURY|nr:glutamate-1-semialdehyde 2,1-aminomutase [Archaeoglobus sulfaticallidus]AGK60582.1 glutamate-1-semialdehyde 2,1-aminomutase [Archaeoglobus sulfaticallidus PM70-1]
MDFNLEKSKNLYSHAIDILPGGVSSPVRAVKPQPFYTKYAKGSRIVDVDGNEYIDCCMAYGPLILGHAHPVVREAIERQLEKGWLYGTPVELEIEYGKLIKKLYPSIEMLRFVNSGSEATMSAIRLARGFTGKKKIVKVEGSFHGAHDAVLVKAGSGATTHGVPNSAGVPEEFVANTLQVPYNDAEALADLLEKNEDVACLILEPIMGNSSLILPEEDYLKEVRKITAENDVLLIFDEIITGFRVSIGGAQELYGIKPDITTLGKIAGGGLPCGIFGGRKEIMESISPVGPVYQAGTFSGNPLTLTAGYATVRFLMENEVYNYLKKLTEDIAERVRDAAKVDVGHIASMFCIYFGQKPRNYQDALKLDAEKFKAFFWELLKEGVFFPPSQYETCFLSYSHSESDAEKIAEAVIECLRKL